MYRLRLFLGLLCLSISACIWSATSPVPLLESTADKIVGALEAHKGQLKKNPDIVRQTVRDYLLPHIDVTGMARSVLGRAAWVRASVSEQARFTQEFTDLVVR